MTYRHCNCGSALPKRPLHDARGYFCTYVCDACESEKRKKYRPEIFTDANYDAPDLGDDDPGDDGKRAFAEVLRAGDPLDDLIDQHVSKQVLTDEETDGYVLGFRDGFAAGMIAGHNHTAKNRTVAVPMWALDCILLRGDFNDTHEGTQTSEDLQTALDIVIAIMQNARANLSEDAETCATSG